MTDPNDERLDEAREAYEVHQWEIALKRLKTVATSGPLPPEDAERMAWAAWWSACYDELPEALEYAATRYSDADDRRGAARMALQLAHWHFDRRNDAVSRGYAAKAARLLAEEPECGEHGWQVSLQAAAAVNRGDRESAKSYAEQAMAISKRLGNRDVEALGLLWLGHVHLMNQRLEAGMALHDEAMALATSGELGLLAAGTVYCSVIVACRNRADWHRASEWTEESSRWCERESVAYFPGLCTVHRAEVMRQQGNLEDAEQNARLASEQLKVANPRVLGWAYQEMAEVRLRRGEMQPARDACRRALELGHDPQPTLARLRLAENDPATALRLIDQALSDPGIISRESRIQLLPVKVSSALAAGLKEPAHQAAAELESWAELLDSPAGQAGAVDARAEIDFAEDRVGRAAEGFKRAWQLWNKAESPYEAAHAQALLAAALREEGHEASAIFEMDAALASLDRLGMALEKTRGGRELAALADSRVTPSNKETLARALMFTDIVDSTKLIEALGDEAWDTLRQWYQRTLRRYFEDHGGVESDHAGDGFFLTFSNVDNGIACAVDIQRALADHRLRHGFAPQVRIGLHAATVVRREDEYSGKGVHEAARIASVAAGGEIIASRQTMNAAWDPPAFSNERTVELNGLASPITIVSVDWRD